MLSYDKLFDITNSQWLHVCLSVRIRLVRVLGELYNYSVVSAPVIYELLYTVINYGHLKEVKAGTESAPGSTGRTALSPGEAPFR